MGHEQKYPLAQTLPYLLKYSGTTMLVLLPDGIYLRDFAAMLRKDDSCYTFNVENTSMLCPGHPLWDPKA